MTIFQSIEKNLADNFILPLIKDESNFDFIYQLLLKDVNKLKEWIVFKYMFEFNGEIKVTEQNIDVFATNLIELTIEITKLKYD